MRENTIHVPFIPLCLILLSILAYKNRHLLPPSLLCLSPFSLLFFFPFSYVLRILHVSGWRVHRSCHLLPDFQVGQKVVQPWRFWVGEEGFS